MSIIIKQNEYDEYEVPGAFIHPLESDNIYFTDDIYDAFDTARHIHGIKADIVFARGTYQED